MTGFSGTTTTTTTMPPNWLSYVPGRIHVFLNGRKLRNDEYTATDGVSVTLVVPAEQYDVVTIACLDITPVANPSDYYYVFLGRTAAWADDNAPPTPVDTRVFDAETKRNIMAVKLIEPPDTSLMIPRVDWTSGVVYPSYHDDSIIAGTSFYAMNTSFRIYKCIYSPGTASTTQPVHTTAGPEPGEDGYIWEFIYEVPLSDRLKFLTADYIPVKFYSTSSTFDHTGLLDYVIINNGGSGYTVAPTVYILGDGTGATAEAVLTGDAVTSINLTDGGSGYSFAVVSIVANDAGTGAAADAVLRASDLPVVINQDVASYALTTAGAINTIEVTYPGSGYINNGSVSVTIVGDGTGATAFLPLVNPDTHSTDPTGINSIEIDQRGEGYTFADVIFSTTTADPAIAKVVIEPQGGHGSNIPQELFSTVVGIAVNIEDIVSDFFTGNDFRQIGVITNIKKYNDLEYFTSNTGNACYVVTPTDISKFSVDDIITTNDGGVFTVVNVAGSTIFLLPDIDLIGISSTLTNTTTAVSGLGLNADPTLFISPEVSVALGNIIYVKNVSPVQRTLGQAEQLKLYFAF